MASTNRFENIGFDDFRRFAKDESMSKYERIGFPDNYRKGHEKVIFDDILGKLSNLDVPGKRVVDIGPGCSDLPAMLIDVCRRHGHALTLIDSQEMLDLVESASFIEKVPAMYPNCPAWLDTHAAAVDVILCYSVLHYVFIDVGFFRFIDASLALLAPGGQMLIGDIPNISKRNRFFASETGVRFHQAYMKTDERPVVSFNQVAHDQIDDAVLMAIIQRVRAQGCDAYLVPQDPALPMANRREDILIIKP